MEQNDRSGRRAWLVLTLFSVATIFSFVDRQLLVLFVEPLKRDLNLTDNPIGLLQGFGPAVFAALSGIGVGWLADRVDRRYVLCGCVLVWSAATAAAGSALNFSQLFACTIGITVGEAAIVHVIYSLIPDLFPGRSRPLANLIFFSVFVLGAGASLLIGSVTLSLCEAIRPGLPPPWRDTATWRLTFYSLAVPGLPIAAALALLRPLDRLRHGTSGGAPKLGAYISEHWRTVLSAYVGWGAYASGLTALIVWSPAAFARAFGGQPKTVGFTVGLAGLAGSIVGLVLAPFYGRWLNNIAGLAGAARGMCYSLGAAALLCLLIPFTSALSQASLIAGAILVFTTSASALTPSLWQDLAPGGLRGLLIGLVSVVYLVGGAISPVLIGALSNNNSGRSSSLLRLLAVVAATGFAVSAAAFALAERPMRRSVASLREAEV